MVQRIPTRNFLLWITKNYFPFSCIWEIKLMCLLVKKAATFAGINFVALTKPLLFHNDNLKFQNTNHITAIKEKST